MNKRIAKHIKQERIRLIPLHFEQIGANYYQLFFNRAVSRFVILEVDRTKSGTLLQVDPSNLYAIKSKFTSVNCLSYILSASAEIEYTVEEVKLDIEVLASTTSLYGDYVFAYGKDLNTGKVSLYSKEHDQPDSQFELEPEKNQMSVSSVNKLVRDLLENLESK